MKINRWIKYAIFGALAVVLTFADQVSKKWIVDVTEGVEGNGFTVIDKVLDFTFVKNEGASMGLFQGQKVMLLLLTVVLLGVGVWYFIKYKPERWLFLTATSFVASGAVGNFIDRLTLGYVRDFIDVQFVNFYIFNFADCVICIGAALLIIYAFLNFND